MSQCAPQTTMPLDEAVRGVRENTSASVFRLEGIHRALTFMLNLIIFRCTPCAQRSKGKSGQRAESNQALAAVLSTSMYVSFRAQLAKNVSQVIKIAKNSAALILIGPGNLKYRLHSSHKICQKRPQNAGKSLEGVTKWKAPPIPQDVEASHDM